jgi:hypothetical protein
MGGIPERRHSCIDAARRQWQRGGITRDRLVPDRVRCFRRTPNEQDGKSHRGSVAPPIVINWRGVFQGDFSQVTTRLECGGGK